MGLNIQYNRAAVAVIDDVQNHPIVATAALIFVICVIPTFHYRPTGLTLQAGFPTFIATAIPEKLSAQNV